jgi:hypothetical protein
VIKDIDSAELRVVFAAELVVAADDLLVSLHLRKLGAHLTSVMACLHVRNLARRSSHAAERTREKKSREERRNARNSV